MPVIFTFDVTGSCDVGGQHLQSRVQCAFQRLGWQHLGGTSYRYPSLDATHQTEDWFNHVVPALMLFRVLANKHSASISKFTLDVQSSTGADLSTNQGTLPMAAKAITLYSPNHPNLFGESNLTDWIDQIPSPYP